MFHRVVERIPSGPLYDIHYTAENLENLIRFLRKRGYEAITFGDLLIREVPRKPVMLTFDDGYEDHYTHLFPMLKKHGIKAVIYLLGDRTVGSNVWDISKGAVEAPLLRKEQILEMAASGFVEFGGHSMTHAKLTELSPAEMERQIRECKSSLEALLGKPILSFAYPYGFFNDGIKKAVAESGYLFGIAVEWGPDYFGEDLMEIRRVCLSPDAGKLEFFWKTSFLYPAFRRWQKRLKLDKQKPASVRKI
jgi:peptidoglycan/xylan/chitin deacetylase (PgdA/CDA1 family)